MKALSIKQPWATLIASGIKNIENRTWKTNFRGTVLIHAGASPSFHDLTLHLSQDQMDEAVKSGFFIPLDARNESYVKSAIIGQVDIVDCMLNHPSVWAEKSEPELWDMEGNPVYDRPTYNWVLANPVLYDKPIEKVKGKLSFWEFNNE